MRTLSLRLNAVRALTGRKPQPAIPDAALAALKEQARALLDQQTDPRVDADADALGWHDVYGTQPPTPAPPRPRPPVAPPVDDLGLKNTPRPTYDPEPPRVQAMAKAEPFGTVPTREPRPGIPKEWPSMSPWERACARLTPSEKAWSSQP